MPLPAKNPCGRRHIFQYHGCQVHDLRKFLARCRRGNQRQDRPGDVPRGLWEEVWMSWQSLQVHCDGHPDANYGWSGGINRNHEASPIRYAEKNGIASIELLFTGSFQLCAVVKRCRINSFFTTFQSFQNALSAFERYAIPSGWSSVARRDEGLIDHEHWHLGANPYRSTHILHQWKGQGRLLCGRDQKGY